MAIALLSFVILALTTSELCATENETIECGTIGNIFEQVMTRISGGKKTFRGEWPFLSALFLVKEDEYNFFCGGSLISSKHVLTAAHCIQDKGMAEQLLPGNISVVLGAYNLTSKTEIGVQKRDVQEIFVHPQWNVKSEKYDADLAILLLKKVVLFTDYIRPVCLPTDDMVLDDVIGSVVGWGRTENGTKANTEFIKGAAVTALNTSYCLTEYPEVSFMSSMRTFCGQGLDGNANRGDSGGAFYVENEEYVYVQRGVVSSTITNSRGNVNPESIVVYTNVANFRNWITDTLKQTANFECFFAYDSNWYTCFIDNVDIRSVVASFSGSHLSQKTDGDVEWIVFRSGTMFFIPSGISKVFKNLKFVRIDENLNKKCIKRSDFKNLENLVDLRIFKNDITTLDYDSFRDLQQLEFLEIKENRLTEIEEETFEMNIKLKNVYLNGNGIEVIPRGLFRSNSLLEIVNLSNNSLKIIDESLFEMNIKLKEVYLHNNNLEVLPRGLFRNNLLLKHVSLYNSSLKIIDELLFDMNINLKEVYLFNNNLEVLPRGLFRNNLLLEIVILSNNSLKIIDELLFEMNIKLKKVYLNNNNLEVLPRGLFRNNLLLEHVSLYYNSLKIIDELLFETNINLREVYLYNNNLEVLPRGLFQNNLLLEIVSLYNNSLKIIDELLFDMNINLKEVYLYNNNLEVLPRGLFRNNLLLEIVSLVNNFLSVIDESTFEANIKLKEVDLFYNKLEVLPRGLFRSNSLLEEVGLNDNLLKIIDESIFDMNINLKKVYLYNNNLEVLSRHLFRNNSLLEMVDLRGNRLKIIETDFTSLKNIKKIVLYYNICINAYYEDGPQIYLNQIRNLTEFQNLIRTYCSST